MASGALRGEKIFQIMGLLVALGLPFALGVPDLLTGRLYAVAGLVAAAAVAAALIVAYLQRPNRPFNEAARNERAAQAAAPKKDTAVLGGEPSPDKWSLELLKRLEWRRFEELCAAYFEALGFRARAGHTGAEGGVDILLYAQGAEAPSSIAQCRAWNIVTVGIKPLRELRAAMISTAVGEGVFVTSGKFTQEARNFAAKEKIDLIDGAALIARIADLLPEKALALLAFATRGDFLTPTCPSCGTKMVAKKSTNDGRKFWGCTGYPRCKNTFFGASNAPA